MTGSDGQPDRLAEIAELAAAFANRILQQHDAGTSIPPHHFNMLVDAARILQDNGAPWPPVVETVLMEVARRVYEVDKGVDGRTSGTGSDNAVVQLIQRSGRNKQSDVASDDPEGSN